MNDRAEEAFTLAREARYMAQTAQSSIDSHDDKCDVRWDNNEQKMEEVKEAVTQLFAHLWIAAGSVIVLLLGISGFLFTRAFPG